MILDAFGCVEDRSRSRRADVAACHIHNATLTPIHANHSKAGAFCLLAIPPHEGSTDRGWDLHEPTPFDQLCSMTDFALSVVCIQDHHLLNSQSPRMIAAAGTVIPGMQNGSLVSQQSTSYTDKKQIRVGGVAALSGGILHRYRYKSIQDKRHWGRYVGRIIRGQTRIQQNKRGRKHKSDDRHRKYTNLAIISVYAAVDSSSPNSARMYLQRLSTSQTAHG